jgi:hypothetical protein
VLVEVKSVVAASVVVVVLLVVALVVLVELEVGLEIEVEASLPAAETGPEVALVSSNAGLRRTQPQSAKTPAGAQSCPCGRWCSVSSTLGLCLAAGGEPRGGR